MNKLYVILLIVFAVIHFSCIQKPPEQPPVLPEPSQLPVFWETVTPDDTIAVNEELLDLTVDEPEEEAPVRVIPVRIILPYTKEYLSIGQETRITVYLENGEYGDEKDFMFFGEDGKNIIEVEGVYNTAVVKALADGEQYLRVSHPKAAESRFIVYDVLPPLPPPPPEIDVSESPLIVRKGETKPLHLLLLNAASRSQENFQFLVVENAYAIEVRQHGNTLNVTGIAPGAGKIRIKNSAALRDYDVMVIVD